MTLSLEAQPPIPVNVDGDHTDPQIPDPAPVPPLAPQAAQAAPAPAPGEATPPVPAAPPGEPSAAPQATAGGTTEVPTDLLSAIVDRLVTQSQELGALKDQLTALQNGVDQANIVIASTNELAQQVATSAQQAVASMPQMGGLLGKLTGNG